VHKEEPEWKLYEKGDPKLFRNWKGKLPNSLAEAADLDPNDFSMCVDRFPEFGTGIVQIFHLFNALSIFYFLYVVGCIHGIYYKRRHLVRLSCVDYRVYPPELQELRRELRYNPYSGEPPPPKELWDGLKGIPLPEPVEGAGDNY